MQVVVKTGGKQILSILSLNISEDVNGTGTCTIKIPYDTPGIIQFSPIEICDIEQNDAIIFSGYIDSFKPSLTDIEITAKSEKNILSKKLVLADGNYNTTAKSMIEAIIGAWNSAYGDTFTVESDIETTIAKEVKKGDNLYDVIEEVAGLIGAVWDCIGGVIRIKMLIGQDYSTPANFRELVYNGANPRENNIDNIELESYGTVSNIIIGDDGTTKSTQSNAESIELFGALGEYKSFRSGSIASQTLAYLDSKKAPQFVFRVYSSNFDAQVGDKIAVRIENVSQYFEFIGTAIVNTKTTTIENGTKRCQYTIADGYVYAPTLAKRIANIESNINTNRLG